MEAIYIIETDSVTPQSVTTQAVVQPMMAYTPRETHGAGVTQLPKVTTLECAHGTVTFVHRIVNDPAAYTQTGCVDITGRRHGNPRYFRALRRSQNTAILALEHHNP